MSPYAVLDDGFHGHPKILRGGPIVELIQLRAIAHCNRYLTDGLIEQAIVPVLLLGVERLEIDGTPAKDIDWVAELLKLGLWERHSRGYLVHDYLDYNRKRVEVEWIKTQKKAAGRKGGQVSAQARAQAGAQPSAAAPAQADASIQAPAQAPAQAAAQARHSTALHGKKLRDVPVAVNGSTTPTDAEIRALIRETSARLGNTTPPALEQAKPEEPPF